MKIAKRYMPDIRPDQMMKAGVALLCTAVACSQQPTFKARIREVIVPVSVMTKFGKPVDDLQADDFVVLNDGKPQSVRMVARDSSPLPIYAVIILQLDDGSAPALAKIKKIASMISGYITNDMGIERPSLAAVVTVADDVSLVQKFTADPDILRDIFAKLVAKGNSSRITDGVNLACDLLGTSDNAARRVIVAISESRDVGSGANFSDVVVKAQRKDILIYTVSYSAFVTALTQKASDRPPAPRSTGIVRPQRSRRRQSASRADATRSAC